MAMSRKETSKLNVANTKSQNKTGFTLKYFDKLAYLFIVILLIHYATKPSNSSNEFSQPQETIWESRWNSLHPMFTGDKLWPFVLVTVAFTTVEAWIIGFFYSLLDLTGKPRILSRYKIQPDKNNPVKLHQMKKLILQVFFNQIFVGIPFTIVAYYAMEWRGCSFDREIPGISKVILDLGVFVIVEEVLFYYSHRLLHHPKIYKYIHKQHHEWIAPISISALYAHPIEYIFSNLLPIAVGPILIKSHVTVMWIWFALGIFSTMGDHSGYHFPLLVSPEFHDFHHLKFNQNYGLLGIMDWFHGTDELFRENKAFERHYASFGLTPLRTLIPDKSK